MAVVDGSFGHPMKVEEQSTAYLAGGILGNGYQCGILWGAALAAGAEAYRRFGAGPRAETEAILGAQRLVATFRARNRSSECGEITRMVWKSALKGGLTKDSMRFILRGGPISCFTMAAGYAPVAAREIDRMAPDGPITVPDAPVSCASLLLRNMGASELHLVMVAGLAGGIGLSGGGCGALGAAIWMLDMNTRPEGTQVTGFDNPKVEELIEGFLESSDYEFECSAIVGRRFESVEDHAGHLHAGGCSQILEALARLTPAT